MGGRLTLCATGTLLAVLLTACGGGGNGSTPAPAVSPTAQGLQVGPARDFGDACRLLPPAEVQSGTGVGPVIGGSRSDPQLGSSCTYAALSSIHKDVTQEELVKLAGTLAGRL
jgi:hypothetical protein